jgi:transcriptional regulator with XRE-family HTH domain
MNSDDTEPLRVRRLRVRQGMSQADLAYAAHVGIKTVKNLEANPHSANVSLIKLHAIARALGVRTSSLFVPPHVDRNPDPVDLHSFRALIAPTPAVDEAPTLDGLRLELKMTSALIARDDYISAVPAVSGLTARAQAAFGAAQTPSLKRATGDVLFSSYSQMVAVSTHLGDQELALKVADKLDALANAESDPVWAGHAVARRSWPLMRQGDFRHVITLTEAVAADLEPDVNARDSRQIAVWGLLMCWLSGAAARDNRPDLAQSALKRAEIAGVMLGHDVVVDGNFMGPAKVATRKIENAVVVDDYGTAAKLARSFPRECRMSPRARHRYVLDVANIHVEHKRYERALDLLTDLRDSAPEWLERQAYAATITEKLAKRTRRTMSPRLRALADFMRIS